jgi:O-antigen/teichoic acid export membrane protein
VAILTKIKEYFLRGHERTIRAKKNILALFILNGYSVAITFALIPLTLKLLDEYKYGIWITLFNMLSWISIFDIGIGNGLRNKFSDAIAKNKTFEARQYVSTAYVLMFGISVFLIGVFVFPWLILDWSLVFKTPREMNEDIFFLIGVTFLLTSFLRILLQRHSRYFVVRFQFISQSLFTM